MARSHNISDELKTAQKEAKEYQAQIKATIDSIEDAAKRYREDYLAKKAKGEKVDSAIEDGFGLRFRARAEEDENLGAIRVKLADFIKQYKKDRPNPGAASKRLFDVLNEAKLDDYVGAYKAKLTFDTALKKESSWNSATVYPEMKRRRNELDDLLNQVKSAPVVTDHLSYQIKLDQNARKLEATVFDPETLQYLELSRKREELLKQRAKLESDFDQLKVQHAKVSKQIEKEVEQGLRHATEWKQGADPYQSIGQYDEPASTYKANIDATIMGQQKEVAAKTSQLSAAIKNIEDNLRVYEHKHTEAKSAKTLERKRVLDQASNPLERMVLLSRWAEADGKKVEKVQDVVESVRSDLRRHHHSKRPTATPEVAASFFTIAGTIKTGAPKTNARTVELGAVRPPSPTNQRGGNQTG